MQTFEVIAPQEKENRGFSFSRRLAVAATVGMMVVVCTVLLAMGSGGEGREMAQRKAWRNDGAKQVLISVLPTPEYQKCDLQRRLIVRDGNRVA